MGRPTKLTPERIEALVGALRSGCSRDAAAAFVGIDRTTLYRGLRRMPALREQVEQAEAALQVRLASQIQQAGTGDWRASAWLLERRFPREFGRAQAAAVPPDAAVARDAQPDHPLAALSPAEQLADVLVMAEELRRLLPAGGEAAAA
jgi:hypothetical protein